MLSKKLCIPLLLISFSLSLSGCDYLQYSKEIDKLQSKVEDINEKIGSLEQKKKELKNKLQKLSQNIISLEEKKVSLTAQNIELELKKQALAQENNDLKSQLIEQRNKKEKDMNTLFR